MSVRKGLNAFRENHELLKEIGQGDWEKFCDYFVAHPLTWRYFVKFAIQARAKGKQKYSADSLMHRVRWECEIDGGQDEYVVNNNWVSIYARLLACKSPDFAEFFEFRKLKGKGIKEAA